VAKIVGRKDRCTGGGSTGNSHGLLATASSDILPGLVADGIGRRSKFAEELAQFRL